MNTARTFVVACTALAAAPALGAEEAGDGSRGRLTGALAEGTRGDCLLRAERNVYGTRSYSF